MAKLEKIWTEMGRPKGKFWFINSSSECPYLLSIDEDAILCACDTMQEEMLRIEPNDQNQGIAALVEATAELLHKDYQIDRDGWE